MSGKQSKRLRRLEAAQSAQAEALAALEAKRQELRQEALDRALRERREARRRLAEAERARTVWKTAAIGALTAAIAVEVLALAAVWPRAKAGTLDGQAGSAAAEAPVGAIINRPSPQGPAAEEAVLPEYSQAARRFPWARELGLCTVTWYTADDCGKAPSHPAYGITASGAPVQAGWTCAVDPAVIPLGSTVLVERSGGTVESYRAADTGVGGLAVDLYTPDRAQALQNGRQALAVWFFPPAGEEAESCT